VGVVKQSMRVVEGPGSGVAVSGRPMLTASTHTADYCCGNCGMVLLEAKIGQIHNRLIKCTECGSYNSTEI